MSKFSAFKDLISTLLAQLFRDGSVDIDVLQTVLPFLSEETPPDVAKRLAAELGSTTPRPRSHTLLLFQALSKVGGDPSILEEQGRRVLNGTRGEPRKHVARTLCALEIMKDEASALLVALESSPAQPLDGPGRLISKQEILNCCLARSGERPFDPVHAAATWAQWCVDSPNLDSPPEQFTFKELMTVLESGPSSASAELITWTSLCSSISVPEIIELFFFAAEINLVIEPRNDIRHRFLDAFGWFVLLPQVSEIIFAMFAGQGTGDVVRDQLLLDSLPYWAWKPGCKGRVLNAFRDSGTFAELKWAERVSDAIAKCGTQGLEALVTYLQGPERSGRALALETLRKIPPALLIASGRDPGKIVANCNSIAQERPDHVL